MANATAPVIQINEGNVGIGTDSPSTELSVNGAISAITSDYDQGTTGSRLLMHSAGTGNSHSYIQAQSSGGTSNAEDLALQLYGGNVGIGTASPSEKLTINGNDNYVAVEHTNYKWGASNVIGGKLGVINANGAAILDMRRWTGTGSNHGTAAITQTNINGDWGLDFKVGAKTTNTVSTVSRMLIDQSGNVGIGTTDPQAQLNVVAGSTVRTWTPTSGTSAIFESSNSSRAFVSIVGANQSELLFGDAGSQFSGRVRFNHSDNKLSLWASGGQDVTVDNSGNVGIGTTSPSQKLQVVGNTLLNGIKFNTGYGQQFISAGTGTTINFGQPTSYVQNIFVQGTIEASSSVQMGNNTAAASSANAGSTRYRVSGNNSYMDMSMRTGATTYAWVNIVQNNW